MYIPKSDTYTEKKIEATPLYFIRVDFQEDLLAKQIIIFQFW